MVRRNYTEDDVAEAIFDTTDRGLSQNEAAQKRGVPQWTISRRLSGQASRNERIQAHQRIPKSQEKTLIRWVLRQESLGYAPSHSQVRACVEAILQQQGDNKPLGKHWTTRFVKRHPKLSTKIGKRQEAARFDGFTPKAVNWYFDIRENEYGWIKPENTVNVDEGGIMVGFGLDSLVIGSSDPKKKAMLKGVQSRTWTSFIEAVTATGRALKPGIIFKGKELQKQWFLNEFELIANWHYITSPNGWTDNHIALEWLKDVYLPQTEPHDASDARLIILDGHGSHAQDEWMATCFLNNVYCCYLPAHCSHGLQPLDNGIFNVIKGAYRKELQMLASLTDSAPVDKVNFIRAYAKAREAGMRKDIILSGWRFTGNWPINHHKALTHPEIQPDKEKLLEEFKTPSPPQLHSDDTPKTSRQVREMAKHRSRPTRQKYSKIAKGLEALEMKVAVQNARITGLEEQMAQVRRGKKRKAVPNPNRRFMALSENIAAGEALPDSKEAEIEVDVDEEVESVIEVGVSRSQTRASPDDLPFESSSFDAIFRTTHPEKAKLGPSGKRKTSGRVMYECLHCPPDSPWSNGKRGNAIYHAKRKHASILQTEASTVDEHDSDIITRPSKQPRMDSFFPSRPSDTTLRRVFNRQQYIESIVGLLTRRRLPFSAVKWDEMQDIILACNPAIEDLLLTSRDAAMRHITTTFDLYRPQLKAKLQASVSKIHLSTDLWTSPHRHGILAVCVRWVDNGYRLQKALLAMPECRYSHSGERQATLMAEAIEEYGIAKQIGYHTGDNATSNDTCLKHLSQMLQDKYGISFHPNQRRIRCIAHIINLSLQAFLLASSKEALRAALAAASDVTGAEMYEQFYFTLYDVSANEPTSRSEASEQQEQSFSKVWKGKAKRAARKPPDFRDDKFRGWQTIPAMRKLHNIAVWLRNSSIHSDLWEDRVSLRLGIDNDTRWNSWYKLIDNLIRRQSQIKQFLLDYDKEINDNILNSSDWDYLERTYRFLHPFASATLWAEGKNSTLSQILTIMDGLLRHYEKNKEHYSKPETFDRRILHSIEMGWFILDKYYTMTEDAPVYAAALLLDPSKRIRYIERHWPESWHENAIAGVRTIWEEYKTQPETGPAESVDEVSASQKRQPNEWDALLEELEVTEDLGDSMDDLEDFIKATPIKISGSPLQWWCHKDQRKTYPQLSRMAIDILSIAPESADPESAFSGGRRTLSWDRERMTCENLEKVECIGNWLREGHIQKTVHGGMGVITDTGFDSGGGEDSDVNFD
ncbi:hypothetical protein HZS61_003350 [Fusarium oxysporum f. sp. conglutinans]|uniref:HTH CENPB-type domain-containing protein n=2 Tax=Fusarium oxysporum f. sp. conglutinans TaxID=100902 RepID=A0A8H6LF14_FUSOX|nr:hypothetical protein HZS61_003350 [Fusarium oxysporum f. sp. conglutinans]